jgi:hypothetical protein
VNVLRTLRKLLLGETWLLPLGVAALLLVLGLVVKPALGASWGDAGGPLMLAGAVVLLTASVTRRG